MDIDTGASFSVMTLWKFKELDDLKRLVSDASVDENVCRRVKLYGVIDIGILYGGSKSFTAVGCWG